MTLAIFTTQLGAVSETFIRRHVEDLAPGRTVAVAQWSAHPLGGRWTAPCPTLFLDREERRLAPRIARRAGAAPDGLRAAAVTRFLRRHRVTAVLGEYLDQFVEFVPLLDRMGIPYVVQGHGIDLSAALRQPDVAERYRSYGSARAVLTRCEFHRRRLISLGLPAERVHVNVGGIDVPETAPIRTRDAAKRFLAIGRMTPKKGPIYLLEAFRLAAEEDPALTLDYVGGGEMFAAAVQYVDAAGLGGRVRLHGMASEAEKMRLLGECGVFVQHSITDPATGDEEGLPAAIQEAMAFGMAVVSTRHSGIAEAVEHGRTGWLSEERDAAGMARSMLLAAGEGAISAGAAGREKAKALYPWRLERERLRASLGLAA